MKSSHENILWGAATAAYQVEGAAFADGKGLNSWDKFYTEVDLGYNGDDSVEHYYRMKEDVSHFAEIGLQTYRFSVSWARVLPEGTGRINQRGLQFYIDLVDELLAHDIKPYLTLYHWDMPLTLMEKGGWLNSETIDAFLEYSEILFDTFRGKVDMWSTINEPMSEVLGGYVAAAHPPREKNLEHALQVSHSLNVASAKAIKLFRKKQMPGKIGIVLNPFPVYPCDDEEDNVRAAKIAYTYYADWYIRPSLTGEYPQSVLKYCQEKFNAPVISEEEHELMQKYTGDYLGINYYLRKVAQADNLDAEDPRDKFKFVTLPGAKLTDWGWEIYPAGFKKLVEDIYKEYGACEIIVPENGIGLKEEGSVNSPTQDDDRIDYLRQHIELIEDMVDDGFNISAYYVWSAIDLLSWTNGYEKRYGLIGVDSPSNDRFIKKSGYWYKNFIETGSY